METTFSLVAEFQYRENYAFDENGCLNTENPYWKMKGGHTMLVNEGLSAQDLIDLGPDGLKKLVMDAVATREEVQPNGLCEYDLLDWSVEEQSEATLQKVYDQLMKNEGDTSGGPDLNEYGYFVFCAADMGMTDCNVHYLLDVLFDRGLVWWDRENVNCHAVISTHPVRSTVVANAA